MWLLSCKTILLIINIMFWNLFLFFLLMTTYLSQNKQTTRILFVQFHPTKQFPIRNEKQNVINFVQLIYINYSLLNCEILFLHPLELSKQPVLRLHLKQIRRLIFHLRRPFGNIKTRVSIFFAFKIIFFY